MHRWIEVETAEVGIPSQRKSLCGRGRDETNLVGVGGLAVAVVAILVPQGEQSFRYAGLHLVRRVLRGCHDRRVWMRRRIVMSGGRGWVDQKPNGSRLSSDEQLAHFFARGSEEGRSRRVEDGEEDERAGNEQDRIWAQWTRALLKTSSEPATKNGPASPGEVELLRLPRRSADVGCTKSNVEVGLILAVQGGRRGVIGG